MNKVFYNGRERERRGHILNFEDLPIEVKDNFRKIKESIEKFFNKEVDVRVVGSHLEGVYDELSGYDVVIEEDINVRELGLIVSNECQLDVKIFFDTIKYSKSIIK